MLDPREEAAVAAQFGVARTQVRRDHLISHLLAALAPLADDLLFFGGTALSRTILTDGRLSEDIDLMTSRHRDQVAEAVEHRLIQGVRREFPGLRWQPPLRAVRNAQPALLIAPDGLTVRIQLLGSGGHAPWPTVRRSLLQRYADAPPVVLTVPTPASFAAWKTVAWNDRRVSRDLYDLWSLAGIGAIHRRSSMLVRPLRPHWQASDATHVRPATK